MRGVVGRVVVCVWGLRRVGVSLSVWIVVVAVVDWGARGGKGKREDDGKALELARARLGAVEFYASFHRGWKEDFALGVWNSKSDLGMDMVWAWVWAWVWVWACHWIGLDRMG